MKFQFVFISGNNSLHFVSSILLGCLQPRLVNPFLLSWGDAAIAFRVCFAGREKRGERRQRAPCVAIGLPPAAYLGFWFA